MFSKNLKAWDDLFCARFMAGDDKKHYLHPVQYALKSRPPGGQPWQRKAYRYRKNTL